MLEGTRNTDTG